MSIVKTLVALQLLLATLCHIKFLFRMKLNVESYFPGSNKCDRYIFYKEIAKVIEKKKELFVSTSDKIKSSLDSSKNVYKNIKQLFTQLKQDIALEKEDYSKNINVLTIDIQNAQDCTLVFQNSQKLFDETFIALDKCIADYDNILTPRIYYINSLLSLESYGWSKMEILKKDMAEVKAIRAHFDNFKLNVYEILIEQKKQITTHFTTYEKDKEKTQLYPSNIDVEVASGMAYYYRQNVDSNDKVIDELKREGKILFYDAYETKCKAIKVDIHEAIKVDSDEASKVKTYVLENVPNNANKAQHPASEFVLRGGLTEANRDYEHFETTYPGGQIKSCDLKCVSVKDCKLYLTFKTRDECSEFKHATYDKNGVLDFNKKIVFI